MAGGEDLERRWYPTLNPCGGQTSPGFMLRRCYETCAIRQDTSQTGHCLTKGAYDMLGYIVNGSDYATEDRDYRREVLEGRLDQEVIDLHGNPVIITGENLPDLLVETLTKARSLHEAIRICIDHTEPLDETLLGKCSPGQLDILDKLAELQARAKDNKVGYTSEAGQAHVEKVRGLVDQALDLGLDNVALVARQAIAYGLGAKWMQLRGVECTEIPTNPGEFKRVP